MFIVGVRECGGCTMWPLRRIRDVKLRPVASALPILHSDRVDWPPGWIASAVTNFIPFS